MCHGMLEKPKQTLDSRPMCGSGMMEVLAKLVDGIGNVWACEGIVLKGPNHTAVLRSIMQNFPIILGEFGTSSTRGGGRFSSNHVSPVKQISHILGLTQVQASIGAVNMNTKKVMKWPQVFNRKFLLQLADKSTDKMGMGACYNNVIDIK